MIKSFQILGSSAGIPTIDQGVSCYMIETRDYDIMIDCGEGSYVSWLKNKYKWKRLKYIFITHMHPDHTGGLINFLFYRKLSNIDFDIIIYGPENLGSYINMSKEHQGVKFMFNVNCNSIKVDKEMILENDITVNADEMVHSIPCYAYRFNSDNYSIMIATDTLPNDKTIKLAYDCDLLIHESTFLDSEIKLAEKTMHTTVGQALDLAEKANVKKLILSHFSKGYSIEKLNNIYYSGNKCIVNNDKILI